MFEIPILLIVYKRKDSLLQILDKINLIHPSRIYIASDAPLADNIIDLQKNNAVKAVIKEYPFTCEVFTNFQKYNLGCGKGPKAAIDWFFENEEAGIILEDDCLPDVSFFNFCKSMLKEYEHDERIMSISGNNYLLGNIDIHATYYFTKYPNIWGWATWRRAWVKMDFEMDDYLNFLKKNVLVEYTNSQAEFWYWKKLFDNVYNNKSSLECWDYQWLFTIWNNHAFGIAPSVNLVKNIGFDGDATHTPNKPNWYEKVALNTIETIIHSNKIELNQIADDYQFNTIIQPFVSNTIYQKLRTRLSALKNKIKPKVLIWQDNEYFDPIWEERIKQMSSYILPNDKVVDLGCGMMWLKKLLEPTNEYIPVDYKKRGDETIVCDFNKDEFPNTYADIYFISGCLEYVTNFDWFIRTISNYTSRCVVSYCTTDVITDLNVRKNLMWKNNLSQNGIIHLFSKYGFNLREMHMTDLNNHIFYFTK